MQAADQDLFHRDPPEAELLRGVPGVAGTCNTGMPAPSQTVVARRPAHERDFV